MNVDAVDRAIAFTAHVFLANCLNSPTQWNGKSDIVHSEVDKKKK